MVLRDSLGIKSHRTAIKRAQTSLQYFSLDAITFFGMGSMESQSLSSVLETRGTVKTVGIKRFDFVGGI